VTQTSQTDADRLDRRGLGLLAAGHFAIDMSVGALPAFLPLFVALYALSDFQAAMILGASLFASSVAQPIFGLVADRRPAPYFLWGSVLVAVAGLAAAGLAAGYIGVLACVFGSGLGVAAWHPEGARVANRISGSRPTTGLAWFMVGGHLGFSAGPLIAAGAIVAFGAKATLVFLIPGTIAAALLVAGRRRISPSLAPPLAAAAPVGRSHIPGLGLILMVTTVRTWVQFGVLALAPLYLADERGMSDGAVGLVIFAFAMGGAVGTFGGAWLAERIGGKGMLVWTLPGVTPLLAIFIVIDGPPGVAALVASGLLLLASFSVTVAVGQSYLPSRLALAAGLMIGFGAIGSAPLGLALLGAIADILGRETALWVTAALPVIGALMALFLPRPRTTAR
jgi:FSR family fosmidomycin resistance protein-like MFS transporter